MTSFRKKIDDWQKKKYVCQFGAERLILPLILLFMKINLNLVYFYIFINT